MAMVRRRRRKRIKVRTSNRNAVRVMMEPNIGELRWPRLPISTCGIGGCSAANH